MDVVNAFGIYVKLLKDFVSIEICLATNFWSLIILSQDSSKWIMEYKIEMTVSACQS